jgi:hypothetical protein
MLWVGKIDHNSFKEFRLEKDIWLICSREATAFSSLVVVAGMVVVVFFMVRVLVLVGVFLHAVLLNS